MANRPTHIAGKKVLHQAYNLAFTGGLKENEGDCLWLHDLQRKDAPIVFLATPDVEDLAKFLNEFLR